jgi:hypothetical protein
VLLHVVLFGALIRRAALFQSLGLEKPAPETIDIDLSYELPKGPVSAPAHSGKPEAMRRSDERKSMQIIRDREKRKKEEADVVKPAREKAPISNKLAFKNQAPPRPPPRKWMMRCQTPEKLRHRRRRRPGRRGNRQLSRAIRRQGQRAFARAWRCRGCRTISQTGDYRLR